MAAKSLEQERAQYAWTCVQGCSGEYRNLAKGAPALIMGNGLMQSLAFWQAKSEHAQKLVSHIAGWIAQSCKFAGGATSFSALMAKLQACESSQYMLATEEALEALRWIRQFADAVGGE